MYFTIALLSCPDRSAILIMVLVESTLSDHYFLIPRELQRVKSQYRKGTTALVNAQERTTRLHTPQSSAKGLAALRVQRMLNNTGAHPTKQVFIGYVLLDKKLSSS